MKIQNLHPWVVPYAEASAIQKKVSQMVKIHPLMKKVEYIAGADVAYSKKENIVVGGVCVFTYPQLKIIEKVWSSWKSKFPYIPGLLTLF